MRKCYLVLKNASNLPDKNNDFIGVDMGAYICIKNNCKMIGCVGDFDSVNEEQYRTIINNCNTVIKHDPIKDFSDSELAINYAIKLGYDEIIMIGGLQDRFDHSYVNLMLLKKYRECLKICDDLNYMYIIDKGQHNIVNKNYKYISFFPLENLQLTLIGTKYELNDFSIDKDCRLGLSNEIIESSCTVNTSGLLLCIQSNDKTDK